MFDGIDEITRSLQQKNIFERLHHDATMKQKKKSITNSMQQATNRSSTSTKYQTQDSVQPKSNNVSQAPTTRRTVGNKQVNIGEYLYAQGVKSQEIKKELAEQVKMQRDQAEQKDLTFKPSISQTSQRIME